MADEIVRFRLQGRDQTKAAFESADRNAQLFARSMTRGVKFGFMAAAEASKPFASAAQKAFDGAARRASRFAQAARAAGSKLADKASPATDRASNVGRSIADQFGNTRKAIQTGLVQPLTKALAEAATEARKLAGPLAKPFEVGARFAARFGRGVGGTIAQIKESITRGGIREALIRPYIAARKAIRDGVTRPWNEAVSLVKAGAHELTRPITVPFRRAARAAAPFARVAVRSFQIAGQAAARAGLSAGLGFASLGIRGLNRFVQRSTSIGVQVSRGVLRGAGRIVAGMTRVGRAAARAFTSPFRAINLFRVLAITQIAANITNLFRSVGRGVSAIGQMAREAAAGQVVMKSFGEITRTVGDDVSFMADRIVRASSGTITQLEAMVTANRALTSGLNFGDFLGTVEFASKRAVATGESASTALRRLVLGLQRASPKILDDFGLLNDGLQGVKLEFDRINGAGAFNDLGPAAQNAEIIRQAMQAMRQQLGTLNVDTKSTAFTFEQIRASASDIASELQTIVFTSPTVQRLAENMRDVARNIRQFVVSNSAGLKAIADNSLGGLGTAFKAIAPGIKKLFDFDDSKLKSIVGFFGQIPLIASRIGIQVKRVFLDVGSAVVTGVGVVVKEIGLLVGSLNPEWFGDLPERASDIFALFEKLKIVASDLNRQARQLDGPLADIDRRMVAVADGAEKLSNSFENAASRERWFDFKTAIRDAFAGLRRAPKQVLDPLIQGFGKLQAVANLAGDRFAKAFDAARQKVDETKQALERAADAVLDARRRLAGLEQDASERRFQVALARAGDNDVLRRRLTFERASDLFGRGRDEKDPEIAKRLLDQSRDLLQDLLTDPAIIRDRGAFRLVGGAANEVDRLLQVGGKNELGVELNNFAEAQRNKAAAQGIQFKLGLENVRRQVSEGLDPFFKSVRAGKAAIDNFNASLNRAAATATGRAAQANNQDQQSTLLGSIARGLLATVGG